MRNCTNRRSCRGALRAVRLDPRNAVAQASRSRFLAATGHVDEAAEAALVAVALDPGSVGYVNGAMQHLAFAGRYPEAIRFANRFWEMDSTLSATGLGVIVLWEGGQVAEARRRAEVLLRLSPYPGNINRALYVIAKTGDSGRAATLLSQQRARFAGRDDGGAAWSTVWLALGDAAQALTGLEEFARRGNLGVATPLGSRIYDPLRASPRFAALVRSLGLDMALFTSPDGGRSGAAWPRPSAHPDTSTRPADPPDSSRPRGATGTSPPAAPSGSMEQSSQRLPPGRQRHAQSPAT